MIAKSESIKGAGRKFGGCARKAVELTSGDLRRVRCIGTEGTARFPDREFRVDLYYRLNAFSLHELVLPTHLPAEILQRKERAAAKLLGITYDSLRYQVKKFRLE